MPIDPNIPLAAGNPSGPFGPDMNQVWQSYNQAYRQQLQQNDLAGQNALRNVFRNQNALDPSTGLPLTSALASVGQINPQTYYDALAIGSKIQEQQQHSAVTTMLRNQKLVQSWDSAVVSPLSQLYERLQSQGIPDDQKKVIIEQEQKKLTDQWQNNNAITDSDRSRFDKPFNPSMMAQSQAFQKRMSDIGKGWEHHIDGNGVGYWTNNHDPSFGPVTEDKTQPYKPVGGPAPKDQPKPLKKDEGLPATIKTPEGGTREGTVYKYPDGSTVDADTNEPLKPGTFTIKPTQQRPRELAASGLMEAQIKNEDGTFSPRTIRQERNADGTTKTTYADGPEAGKEVPSDSIKPNSIKSKSVTEADKSAIDATVDEIGTYKIPPLNSYAMRSGNGPAIIQGLKERYPDYSAQKYHEADSIRQDFARGPTSRRVDALNTAIQHLDVFTKLEENLKANKGTPDVPMVNAVINYAQTQAGHPEVTSFNAAKDVIADEVMKTIIAGGGALTDRTGMQKNLSASASASAINQTVDTLKQLMGGAMGSLERRWTSGGILSKDEFREKMNPETLAALDKYLPKSQKGGESDYTEKKFKDIDTAKAGLPSDGFQYHLGSEIWSKDKDGKLHKWDPNNPKKEISQ